MQHLTATLTTAFDGGPLAMIDGLPGGGAELRPQQVRALAAALLRVADDVEKRKPKYRGRLLPADRRVYPVQT